LAQAGEEVYFLARGNHLQALRNHGLNVVSPRGDFVIPSVQATDEPGEVGEVDAVLVGVKAWQVPEAARVMRPLVGPETLVLPLQNGVEAPAQLAEILGAERVLGGVCRIISFVAGPGRIRHAGAEPFIQFGELDKRLSDRVEHLRRVFEKTKGVTAEVAPDIQAAMWRKFLLIASWSGVGAITRAPVGIFLGLPQTRRLVEGVMQEVANVARAQSIALPDDVIEKTLAFMDGLPSEGTASMQRDIMEGRPSELESQNGAVVRLGREAGIETPLNAFIYSSLLPLELKARGKIVFPF
jgi:2-dehydropantoate 2-reductase